MVYTVYDHVDVKGTNTFKAWTLALQKVERAKLNNKLDMLATAGANLPPGLLSDTGSKHIKKIRINGAVALRPMLCHGPVNHAGECTLLLGAIEKDRKLIPGNAYAIAEALRQQVAANPAARRKHHERVA